MADFHEICSCILGATTPLPGGPWQQDQHRRDPDGRSGVIEPASLLSQLTSNFSQEDLTAAAVVDFTADGPSLNRLLTGDWIALRDQDGRYADVLGAEGCLRRPGPALLNILADPKFSDALAQPADARVFIAESIAHMVALRSLGLAAVTGFGLDDLRNTNLLLFAYLLRQDFSADMVDELKDLTGTQPSSVSPPPFIRELVLVDWSPAAGVCAADGTAFEGIINHFVRLQQLCGLPLYRVRRWQPQITDLEQFQFAAQYGTPSLIRKKLIDNLTSTSEALAEAPPADQLTLAGAFQNFLGTPNGTTRDEFEQCLHERLVRPELEILETLPSRENEHALIAAMLRCEVISQMAARSAARRQRVEIEVEAEKQVAEWRQTDSMLKTLIAAIRMG